MKELIIKKDVKILFELDEDLAIVDSENLFIDKQLLSIKKYDYLYETRKNIYATKNNSVFRLGRNNLAFRKISDKIITENIIDKNIVLTAEYVSIGKFNKVCYINGEEKWNRTIKNYYIVDNGNILLERDAIKTRSFSKINIENGGNEWHFTLPEGFTIFGKIQVVKDVLFFKAFKNDGDYNKQYGLDIKNGKILWELNFEVPYNKNNIAFNLNTDNNLSYGYGGNLYQVFDPIKGKVLVEKDMSKYYEQGIDPNVHRNTISEEKLWFVGGRGESAKFGVLNIKTHEIEFVQDYPLEKDGQFDKPVYHKDKLYLRERNDILHIFEKE